MQETHTKGIEKEEKSPVTSNCASAAKPDPLLDRVVSILEQTRGNVVRAVNTNMVLAYWLIGWEIVGTNEL